MEASALHAQTEESRAVVLRALDGLARGDAQVFGATLADDVRWEMVGQHYLPGGTTYVGKEAVMRDLVGIVGDIYDVSTFDQTMRHVVAEGPIVFAEFALSATTAKGRQYDNSYVFVFEIGDGLVRKVRDYTDTLYAKRVLFD